MFKKGNIPWIKGKHHTEETIRLFNEINRGKNNPMYGKHHSEETKRKISQNKERAKKSAPCPAVYPLVSALGAWPYPPHECGDPNTVMQFFSFRWTVFRCEN